MTDSKRETTKQAQQAEPGGQPPALEARSENLLPAGGADDDNDADGDGAGDGRFEVAEEVNLDVQSDPARRVGALPQGAPADALAGTLKTP